jgi:hypothetical protein
LWQGFEQVMVEPDTHVFGSQAELISNIWAAA